jgi:hypothetical protein
MNGSGEQFHPLPARIPGYAFHALEQAIADAGLTPRAANGPAPIRLPEALPWAPLPWDALHAALAK